MRNGHRPETKLKLETVLDSSLCVLLCGEGQQNRVSDQTRREFPRDVSGLTRMDYRLEHR